MKGILKLVIVLIIIVAIIIITGFVYIVGETNQVVITQFGKPVAQVTKAGLHFKKPFIQQVNYFEKRLLQWDGNPNQIPTKDKKYIWVDTTARWKISNALKFLQSVGNEISAQARLDDIINSATRDAVTNHLLVETVRDTNRITQGKKQNEDITSNKEALRKIKIGREGLEKIILKNARQLVPHFGIELVDVRIKRVNYVDAVRRKVYNRMIAERKRAAEKYRSEGQGKRAEVEGLREKELKKITSQAYRKAQIIKGKADAQVTKIYAQAYSQGPEFYSFLKTLNTYKNTIDKNSIIILTTDSEYYKYLKKLGFEK
jgi:membrane protease subunit HflC